MDIFFFLLYNCFINNFKDYDLLNFILNVLSELGSIKFKICY